MADIEEAKNEEANADSQQSSHHWLASSYIYVYEIGERACFYTIKASIPMLLYMYLEYSKTSTIVIYHVFESIASFSCLLGAIFADGHIGKLRTILFSSMLYFLGLACLIVSAIPQSSKHIFALLGLAFCAIACGGIRPTIAAFGGDQFPESSYQNKLLLFFVIYVAVSYVGMFFGQILTPVLRDFKPCYKTECYLLPFVAGLLMLVCAIVSLLFGQSKVRMGPVKTHVVILALFAIGLGIVRKIKAMRKRIPVASHWLDHAIPECGAQIVADTKILMRLLLLTLPAPLFFIIYCQTGSNWVFQARYMNRTMGHIEPMPELIVLVYPLLAIVFIPIYYFAIYRLLNLLRMRSLVQKITIGGFLATISMALAAVVEANLEKTQLLPPERGICQFRIYNGIPYCNITITTDIPVAPTIRMRPMGLFENMHLNVRSKSEFTYNLTSEQSEKEACPNVYNQKFKLEGRSAVSYFFTKRQGSFTILRFFDITKKPFVGAMVRVLATGFDVGRKIKIRQYDDEDEDEEPFSLENIDPFVVKTSFIEFNIWGKTVIRLNVTNGDVIVLMFTKTHHGMLRKGFRLASASPLSVFWLIPQYVFLAMADVIITISVLHFAYVTAPASMKTLFIGCWYMAILLGNLLLIIIMKLNVFTWKKYEYIFYAVLMLVGTVVFSVIAYLYQREGQKEVERND